MAKYTRRALFRIDHIQQKNEKHSIAFSNIHGFSVFGL